tara:strand:- start:142 stop:654 length:513 start_codon:yes stop_codon:yes gene_type:complete
MIQETKIADEALDLSSALKEKIDKLVPRYPEKKSASLPLLHLIQEEKGYISKPAMEWVAEKVEVEPISIYGLVTFYPMLREKPIGKKHIKVCRTLSCALNGGYNVCDTFKKEFDCDLGEISEGGEATIEFVECLASCGSGPVVQVNEVMHENVTPEKAAEIAKQIRSGKI